MSDAERFDFDRVDAFVPGAVGEPGRRTFYLQARLEDRIVTLRCEKQQVGMLGRYLAQLSQVMGPVEADRDVVGLLEPVEPAWTIGQLAVGVDERTGEITVTAEELVAGELDLEGEEDVSEEELEALIVAADLAEQAAEARFVMTAGQALAFAERAEELVAAGRPSCRLCGAPVDPEGHACPRWN